MNTLLENWQIEEIRNYWKKEIGFPVLQQHRTINNHNDIVKFSAPFVWIHHHDNGCLDIVITNESEIQNNIYISEEKAKLLMEVLEEMYL